ncbi:MAG TPA: NADH-quinone oxidoreductase subunit N [Acidimicrobiales bacterium]|nr:NADH-quinone oxidoreductase subunit N [Acidimicrobiales bacterium]
MTGGVELLAAGCSVNSVTGSVSGICTAKGSLSLPINYAAIAPLFVLGGMALVLLLVSAMLPKRRYPGLWMGLTALAGLGTVVDGLVQWHDVAGLTLQQQLTMGDQIFYDQLSAFFAILFGCATAIGALVSDSYLTREGLDGPEPYILMLACSTGAVLMAEAANLISLFLGLEILSIALYTLSAYHNRRTQSGEAGLKYFILGSFASAIFIYGVALVYGATGSTSYLGIISFLINTDVVHDGVLLAGLGLLIVGLGFKVAAVPFHFWSPDVYQGAPTPFVGYMAAVAKAAGFAGLVRVLMQALEPEMSDWRPVIWVLAVASVLVGSVLALVQVDLKRMLAYSSVSQAGYILIALQAGTAQGVTSVCFYLFTYTFMVLGTFAVISVVQGRGEARNDLSAVRGLAARNPWLAAGMLVLLLGQAGIPLTSGFLGKWVVISAALQQGQYALGLIGMLGAAIAAFFYLRVALLMYMPPTAQSPVVAVAGAGAAGGPGTVLGPVGSGLAGAYFEEGSDLSAIATAGLEGRDTTLALRLPPGARLRVPPSISAVVGLCALFTIFAGVSTPVLSLAHTITLPWSV